MSLRELLQRHYSEADERMAGLPFYNSLLSVEMAVWHCLDAEVEAGVLITPWCVNLIWHPTDPEALPEKGETCILALPSGEYEGVVAEADGLGRFASASLVSDTRVFESQESARTLACEIADLLFAVPAPDGMTQPDDPGRRALFRRALGGS